MTTNPSTIMRLFLVICVIAFIVLFYSNYNSMKQNVSELTHNVTTLKENSERLYDANQSLADSVEDLYEIKKMEAEQLSKLHKRLDDLSMTWYKYTQEMQQLEKDAPHVKDFMDSIVPDPVAGLLNDYSSKIR